MRVNQAGNEFVVRGGKGQRRPLKQRALLTCDSLLGLEEFEMRSADVRQHADVRLGDVTQGGDFTRMIRTHLDDQKLGVIRTVENRQRQPDVVVEVPFRRVGLSGLGEKSLQQLLRRRLARRTGDADDRRLERMPIVAGTALQLVQPVDDIRRTGGQGLGDEGVSVRLLALQGDKPHAGANLTGIERPAHQITPRWELR